MHRHRPRVSPLDLPSPEEDLCEISMQLDQNDLGPYQHRIPPDLASITKTARFDGRVKAELTNDPPYSSYPNNRCLTASRLTTSQKYARITPMESSQQMRPANVRQDMRRAFSQQIQRKWNSTTLKNSRERYLREDLANEQGEARPKEGLRKAGQKLRTGRQVLSMRQSHGGLPGQGTRQVQAVNYPILFGNIQGNSPKKVVAHIGKIRHLMNAKGRRWP